MTGLSQKDIDELMGNIDPGGVNKEKTQVPGEEKVTGKIFSFHPKTNIRFEYSHPSSVIKKEDTIYNPSIDFREKKENILKFNPNPKKVIVRTVENYNEFKHKAL